MLGNANPSQSVAAQEVTSLYQNILNRQPDSGGLTYWTGLLTSGQDTLAQEQQDFLTSTEYLNSAVDQAHWASLNAPTPSSSSTQTTVVSATGTATSTSEPAISNAMGPITSVQAQTNNSTDMFSGFAFGGFSGDEVVIGLGVGIALVAVVLIMSRKKHKG